MMTVNDVSKWTGVSIRTLQYYDTIGLLPPTEYTKAGYRLYDDTALDRLQQILLFKELEFPLKEIKQIIDSPNFDRNVALEQQIELLTMKKEHLESLITFARKIKMTGVKKMDFNIFDTSKIDAYAKAAQEQWGQSTEYKEYEEKAGKQSPEVQKQALQNLMLIFVEFGKMVNKKPTDSEVQHKVRELQNFITDHFYKCSNEILNSLGIMYASGGEFTENIDNVAGNGTAAFVAKAIEWYCK